MSEVTYDERLLIYGFDLWVASGKFVFNIVINYVLKFYKIYFDMNLLVYSHTEITPRAGSLVNRGIMNRSRMAL